MPNYIVQLQAATGEVVEMPYRTRWDSTKVSTEEVTKACAAEKTVFSGKTIDGAWKRQYAGVSAVLQD